MHLGILEILYIIIGLSSLIPQIFFLITLQNTFNQISEKNRKMQSGEVWLALIPLFGVFWQFVIVNRMADSLKAEFTIRNIEDNEDRPGITIGLAYCILFCLCIIPLLGILTLIAGYVCMIIYWVKIYNYKIILQQKRTL